MQQISNLWSPGFLTNTPGSTLPSFIYGLFSPSPTPKAKVNFGGALASQKGGVVPFGKDDLDELDQISPKECLIDQLTFSPDSEAKVGRASYVQGVISPDLAQKAC